jgi:ABC-type transport system substrate-binding protein
MFKVNNLMGLIIVGILLLNSLTGCAPKTTPLPLSISTATNQPTIPLNTPIQPSPTLPPPTSKPTLEITNTPKPTPTPTPEPKRAEAGEEFSLCKLPPELTTSSNDSTSIALKVALGAPMAIIPASLRPGAASQQEGKVYRVAVLQDITSTNYWAANGPDNTVYNSYMLPQRLSLYTLTDKYFTFVPSVAQDFPPQLVQEGDYWSAEIPIKKDIKWSDGSSLTAKDIAFTANTTLKFGLASGNWSYRYNRNFLDRVEAIDELTVKLYYHKRPGLFAYLYGTLQAPILQESFWSAKISEANATDTLDTLSADANEEQKSAAQEAAQKKLFAINPESEPTAGGYILSQWKKGAFLELTRNKDYFQSGLVIQQWSNGAYQDSNGVKVGVPEGTVESTIEVGPHFDQVIYSRFGSSNSALQALQNGKIDFILNPSLSPRSKQMDQLRSDPNITVIENSPNGFRYLSFNMRRKPVSDCAFRQAVAILIDQEYLSQTVFENTILPSYSIVPEGNTAWHYPNTAKIGMGLSREQRLNLAVNLLGQAGYTWQEDKKPTWDAASAKVVPGGTLIMPDGKPVPSLVLVGPDMSTDSVRAITADWIKTWLGEVGISVRLQLSSFNNLVSRVFTKQDFDMFILGWSLSFYPDYLVNFFTEEQAASDGNNAGGYSNPEYDKWADELNSCETIEYCKDINDQLQVALAIDLPYVVLFQTKFIEVFRNDLIVFPYLQQFGGLAYTHAGGSLQNSVKPK